MAHLAVIGSHHVNGVAQLHTELMRKSVFAGFVDLYPARFVNVTNGIAVRRWLKQSNPGLSALLTQRLGFAWENDLEELTRLVGAADEPEFLRHFRGIKRTNKQRLADEVMRRTGVELDIDSMFDVQVKRIHEYKRQLLNLLYVVTRYRRIRRDPRGVVPRAVLFAGKAAPGYFMAKAIIKLINNVARTINADPDVRDAPASGVLAGLRRVARAEDHAGRGSVGADLDRGHGSFRHRQHEARAERVRSPSARWTAPTSRFAITSARRTYSFSV